MSAEPMSEGELAAIAARAALASPGPWKADDFGDMVWGPNEGEGQRIADTRGYGYLTGILKLSPDDAAARQQDDGNFIAAARFDVPRLVDEVRRLQGALRTSREAFAYSSTDRERKLDELLVEVETVLQCVSGDPAWQRKEVFPYGLQDPGGVNGCLEKVKALLHPKPAPMCKLMGFDLARGMDQGVVAEFDAKGRLTIERTAPTRQEPEVRP